MTIHESAEDYLEAILMLRQQKGYVRSVDIAAMLNVTKPSVSIAMKRLRENGYILMAEDSLITLTAQGEAIASRMLERHRTLAAFLEALGVDKQTALEDACKIEHDLSEQSFEAICRHVKVHMNEE
ncbi:MAG: metal-dependent transcriptional regulator [Aristaeellaceae bacterium]